MKTNCIACGYTISYPIYNSEDQPLVMLNLPKSELEAKNVLTFPMNYRSCANCGHIFNIEFDYYKIPYQDNSNFMYNDGIFWQQHMSNLIDELVEKYDAKNKTIIDIGCGDGKFLKILIEKNLNNSCIGYEPGIEAENARKNGLDVYQDYFIPERDLKYLKPDLIICRHVIEHLHNPKEFVSDIAYWCNMYDNFPLFMAEVPRIDKAIKSFRINDFSYEHVSNFTEFSFKNMFEVSGFEVLDIQALYEGEVSAAFVRPKKIEKFNSIKNASDIYRKNIGKQKELVHYFLNSLLQQDKKIAFWGATGKGAAFFNFFDILNDTYPLVIDSDYRKNGRFVPKTGQEIKTPDYIIENPVDIIIITPQWRAKDIFNEIKTKNIKYEKIFILLNGIITEYTGEKIITEIED